MKIVQYAERGNPVDVVKVLEVDAPSAGPGEVVLDVLAWHFADAACLLRQ